MGSGRRTCAQSCCDTTARRITTTELKPAHAASLLTGASTSCGFLQKNRIHFKMKRRPAKTSKADCTAMAVASPRLSFSFGRSQWQPCCSCVRQHGECRQNDVRNFIKGEDNAVYQGAVGLQCRLPLPGNQAARPGDCLPHVSNSPCPLPFQGVQRQQKDIRKGSERKLSAQQRRS